MLTYEQKEAMWREREKRVPSVGRWGTYRFNREIHSEYETVKEQRAVLSEIRGAYYQYQVDQAENRQHNKYHNLDFGRE